MVGGSKVKGGKKVGGERMSCQLVCYTPTTSLADIFCRSEEYKHAHTHSGCNSVAENCRGA
jgi:hypothetical protein